MKASKILLAALLTALAAPATLAQAPLNDAPAADQSQHDKGIDPKILIKAKAAFSLLKGKNPPILVDVRSRPEFNAEHIQGAISFPFKSVQMGGEYPFRKDNKLLLYCGCPHHLSGMSADILKTKGYTDIHVIDEGYWGWKAQGLPIFRDPNAPAQVSLSVTGKVQSAGQAKAFKNIFLLHPASGQLEATRTDAEGRFAMHLHFGGVTPQDQVVIQMDERTLRQLSLAEVDKAELSLEYPNQLASQP